MAALFTLVVLLVVDHRLRVIGWNRQRRLWVVRIPLIGLVVIQMVWASWVAFT
jgi:hypothetical protein